MTRLIKFRVWDKKLGQFLSHVDYSLLEQEDFIFQQYTRLEDNEGEEIYEGDLLELETSGDIFEVCWENSGKWILSNVLDDRDQRDLYTDLSFMKIIGHIYERNQNNKWID